MFKYVTVFLLLISLVSFSEIQNADIGYRTGMVSLGDLEVAGHNGIYYDDGTTEGAVYHFFNGDMSSDGYHPDGINYENQTYEVELRDYDGSGDNERYLGAKKYINISDEQRETIIATASIIHSEELMDPEYTTYSIFIHKEVTYNNDGYPTHYTMQCVGFTEYLYESVGLNPTPDDEEYTLGVYTRSMAFFPF
ncbi:MAG: hypothetical protein GQ534_04620 [Candidatus Delongbacteria bacterium]|nr:hypothetical protein [Candidatus Delongbacteria bacterium]